jgi:hypothetical protein
MRLQNEKNTTHHGRRTVRLNRTSAKDSSIEKHYICEGKGWRQQIPQNLGHDKALPFVKATLHAQIDEQRHVVVEMA